MRLSEDVTVALFGGSAVGKTVLADRLAKRFGLSVRHCGEIAKQTARQLGCRIGELPFDAHDAIDADTRRTAVARRNSSMLIEGRYLDLVLADTPHLLLIELTCTASVRAARKGVPLSEVAAE